LLDSHSHPKELIMSTETDDRAAVLELGRAWVEAELAKDNDTLAAMAHPDLRLVGPLGFILDREQWLNRYQPGQLDTTSLVWDEVHVRVLGDTAISIGRQSQQATFQGRPSNGDFRISHVFVRDRSATHGWLIAGIQLSPIMQPGGAPGGPRP
jgi:ketosteroid isomerase-like protein